MRNIILAGFSATLLCSTAFSAHANDWLSQTYVGVSSGASFMNDAEVSGINASLNAKSGFNLSVNAGYRFNEIIRLQADLGYLRNDFSKIGTLKLKSGAISGAYALTTAYADFAITEKITPFVGLGVGVFAPNISTLKYKDTSFGDAKLKVKDSVVPLFRLSAGASYELTNQLDLVANYDFLQSTKFKFAEGSTTYKSDITAHLAQVGLRYNF